MKKNAIIVAGGVGNRAGGSIPKQFRFLAGRRVLEWSAMHFLQEDSATFIALVVNPDYLDLGEKIRDSLLENFPDSKIEIIAGGKNRLDSVAHGLSLIPEDENDSLVAVHDGARPLISISMICNGWQVASKYGSAVPVIPLTDSIRHLCKEGSESVDRCEYVAVQTPQVFRTSLLKSGYAVLNDDKLTDDASVIEAIGEKVKLYSGDPTNIKITNPKDFAIAEMLMSELE